jgi:hypothetical protein
MSKFETFLRRQNVTAILAVIIVLFGCIYLTMISFLEIPKENKEYVLIIIGFLTGGAMGSVVSYHFGQSKKQADHKNDGTEDTGA